MLHLIFVILIFVAKLVACKIQFTSFVVIISVNDVILKQDFKHLMYLSLETMVLWDSQLL